jgi:hypothetical protein
MVWENGWIFLSSDMEHMDCMGFYVNLIQLTNSGGKRSNSFFIPLPDLQRHKIWITFKLE